MRPDMKKVIISRPRVKGTNRSTRRKIRLSDLNEVQEYPNKISLKKDTIGPHGSRKSQTDLQRTRFLHI